MGDKGIGKHHAARRVLPAQQGLHAHHASVLAHLGLVMQNKFLIAQTLPQLDVQNRTGGGRCLHLGVEPAYRVAPRRLGLVHGQVGLLEQVADAFQLFAEYGDADTAGAVMLVTRQVVRLAKHCQNFFADDLGFFGCDLGVVAQIFQHDHKLVAAQAGHGVGFAHAA